MASALEKTSVNNPASPDRFFEGRQHEMFARLRAEDPVHYTPESEFGPYWSITKWDDIMSVDIDHQRFSSAQGVTLTNLADLERQNEARAIAGMPPRPVATAGFISMDEPLHKVHRKAVTPAAAPANVAKLAPIVRERAQNMLDELPEGETFNWVDRVSRRLTAMTLATLFDFPMENCDDLTFWSDVFNAVPGQYGIWDWAHWVEIITDCSEQFEALWDARKKNSSGNDLLSLLAQNPKTRDMTLEEFQGTLVLLIIGGNDTTRNTISGGVHALLNHPDQLQKLRSDPALIPAMVSETIRWQTPLAYMMRIANEDVQIRDKQIKAGDQVAMWYISGNRDSDQIERPDEYIIDRPRARNHMSFGFGIHRCLGNRVAEMQISIIWEEILKRFSNIEIVSDPVRTYSSFINGYDKLEVRVTR